MFSRVPEIARFLGIKIIMGFNDHGEPHIHARYGKHAAKFSHSRCGPVGRISATACDSLGGRMDTA